MSSWGNQLNQDILKDFMQLFSLGGGEFVQKVFMRVEAHAPIL